MDCASLKGAISVAGVLTRHEFSKINASCLDSLKKAEKKAKQNPKPTRKTNMGRGHACAGLRRLRLSRRRNPSKKLLILATFEKWGGQRDARLIFFVKRLTKMPEAHRRDIREVLTPAFDAGIRVVRGVLQYDTTRRRAEVRHLN